MQEQDIAVASHAKHIFIRKGLEHDVVIYDIYPQDAYVYYW